MRTILVLKAFFIILSVSSQLPKETTEEISKFIKSKREYYNSPSIAVAITDENNTIYLKHFGNAKKRR
ncbi:hypothetical protein [Tenacibaculum agarivorans]|uniref:hypothetical protein n=1 Tax=Tenacibaculum agarivorans TaxID=1908389 RepID=UPI000A94F1E8|nr:hypothetical protein [Tenacibaculum agarivorans]